MSNNSQRYQWIKGDDLGTVEILKDREENFLKFESGRRCSDKVIEEFMITIDDDSDILPLREIQKEETITKAKAKAKYKKQTAGLSISSKPTRKSNSGSGAGAGYYENPILPLLAKSKKTKTKLNTRLSLELPSKEFISVLQDSWDEDILDILSKHLVDQIKDPKKFITEKIKVSLSEWFHKKSG